jgi:uncharacterized membrane protein
MIGTILGIAIGLGAALLLNSTNGYDVASTMVVVGLPAALILSKVMGGPLTTEKMGRGDRASLRRVKVAALVIGVLAAFAFGYMGRNILSGVGLATALLVSVGPRWGLIVDERMGKAYDRSATIAFAVFSLGAAYLGFYQGIRSPGQTTVESFIQLAWLSWTILLGSWGYYYFVGGEG